MSSAANDLAQLDRNRLRELFDLRLSFSSRSGGDYEDDPYPRWQELREQRLVHEGTVHELTGYLKPATFQGLPFPERQHFSVFDYSVVDEVLRNEAFVSSPEAVDATGEAAITSSMLSMDGPQHRRYRGLVQPSFVPARAQWWIRNWIEETVQALIDSFVNDGRAELNVDFCAAIPVLTITGSFGVGVEQALTIRESLSDPPKIISMLAPIVAARRESPQDDLISILVEAELKDEDGTTHRLSDVEIYSFAFLLLAAGSGTTWKQMGITLTALLQRPEVLAQVKADRELLRPTIEESLRWMPTDPMFARFVTDDVDIRGTMIPAGSVMHMNFAAANRDPARWENPDEFDIHRPRKASFAFGGGNHICLGMHVARAEMAVGIGALLDRLPNLRLDPDAEPPRYIGMYERGATAIPVVFG
jgi:cytochrome P450